MRNHTKINEINENVRNHKKNNENAFFAKFQGTNMFFTVLRAVREALGTLRGWDGIGLARIFLSTKSQGPCKFWVAQCRYHLI